MRSSLIKAGLISFASGLFVSDTISKYWQKRKIHHVDFGRYFNSNFFEEALFKDKIASQCRNHSEFHAMVGICLLLLQLIKEPQDQPVVYKAFESLRLEDLYTYAPSLRKSIANQDAEPSFVNNDKSLYYQFAVEKAFSIMSQIRFSKDEAALAADELSEVMKCLTDRMCVMFHGTNSFFLERIKQEGLRGDSANAFHVHMNMLNEELKER